MKRAHVVLTRASTDVVKALNQKQWKVVADFVAQPDSYPRTLASAAMVAAHPRAELLKGIKPHLPKRLSRRVASAHVRKLLSPLREAVRARG